MTGQQATGGKRELGDKVLLLATSHTGNNIFCTPAIQFLKKHYPATQFDVVAPKKLNAQVFERNPAIGRVYNVRRAPLVRLTRACAAKRARKVDTPRGYINSTLRSPETRC